MYFVKKINLDINHQYKSSEIVDNINKSISNAFTLLENSAKSFVKEECGREAGEHVKIIEINDFNQVNEPVVDSMLLYRLVDDRHRIYVYQKKTMITKIQNWTWGTSDTVNSQFSNICIFELEEYNKINVVSFQNQIVLTSIPNDELVAIGPANIKIPKPMTISPMCDLISELKKSPKFKARFEAVNDVIDHDMEKFYY
ncbi:hypothetical protein QLL95_gp0723 [Cotonvirus japonicus]|uniref:Uncharacterized protein n=1 Tax=Cotonvirus japonicus TaxID=2811091 RepID=A0ABM7NTA0_9VIRU|nr:hypothetical protein QLL95_gp0723 [Cotonvirus japonicus]BCS83400.1 hypothetical protein [Cotonvirus japonicus]